MRVFLLSLLISFSANGELVGKGKFEYSIFKVDVYEVSHFKTLSTQKLVIKYLRDISQKYSKMGWKKGLKRNINLRDYKEPFNWIISLTPDIKKGDTVELVKEKNLCIIKHNGKVLGKSSDPNVEKILFLPWIGPKPISKSLKDQLLGR